MIRAAVLLTLAILAAGCGDGKKPAAGTARLSIPDPADEVRLDFEEWKEADWTSLEGTWALREVADAPSGKHVLEQSSTDKLYPAVVWNGDEFGDVEVSVKFRLVSGDDDASGGIVLREADGRYYVCRANALEGNFRLYTYAATSRTQIAGVDVTAPAKGAWHTLAMVAVGDRIQCSLDGEVLIDHHDAQFAKGKVGLWTKCDSVTQFDDLVIRSKAVPLDVFAGLDFAGDSAAAKGRFFSRANAEKCPCGSGRTLARCRKAGCAKALERGRAVLEAAESE